VARASVGDPGWQQTAPRAVFWGEPAEAHSGDLILRYYQRDAPYVRALLPHLVKVSRAAADDLRYGLAGHKVIIHLYPEQFGTEQPPANVPTGISYLRREISLPSPWVSGVPADGIWDQSWLAAVSYDVTYALAQKALYSASGSGLSPLQRALADEYAAWASQGRDPAQAPLLGRVVERRGEEALPMMFLSLKNTRLPALFVAQWMSLYPSWQDVAFFEMAMNVEREALLAGRKETFLLFQGAGLAAAEAWYETGPVLNVPPVRVASVHMDGELALVRVEEPEALWDAWRRCAPGEDGRPVCSDAEWWNWMDMRRVGRAGPAE
jgi:hypothetical protein